MNTLIYLFLSSLLTWLTSVITGFLVIPLIIKYILSFSIVVYKYISYQPYRCTCLKPIFHQKLGSRWVPNANETYTKNMKCTWPTPAFCVGTQRNLYSTGWHRGLASGKTQLFGFASGKTRKMCVTQRQKYQHVGIFCVR